MLQATIVNWGTPLPPRQLKQIAILMECEEAELAVVNEKEFLPTIEPADILISAQNIVDKAMLNLDFATAGQIIIGLPDGDAALAIALVATMGCKVQDYNSAAAVAYLRVPSLGLPASARRVTEIVFL